MNNRKRRAARIEAAIRRASRGNVDAIFFEVDGGERFQIDAIKRLAAPEETPGVGARTVVRRAEFFVGAATLRGIRAAAGGLDGLRRAKIVEEIDGDKRVWRLDAALPYLENSPGAESYRLVAWLNGEK
ncbi:MAG: hypothetical protein IJE77_06195 [Thermoguttaceae bacterium]|nr:hypothetical protein [Thermoguttaceae bacterium]MBQ9800266.1 hypothetical protein [Thermoguttaceae bacterium]